MSMKKIMMGLAAGWMATMVAAMAAPSTETTPAEKSPPPSVLAHGGSFELVFIGKLEDAQIFPGVGKSDPPYRSARPVFTVEKVIQGDAKAGDQVTLNYARHQNEELSFPVGKRCKVGAKGGRLLKIEELPAGPPEALAAAPADALKQFTVRTDDFQKVVPGSNLYDWMDLFSHRTGGFFDTSNTFKSRQELVDYSNVQLAGMPHVTGGTKVAELIADRVEQQMDFAKNDLVIVHLSTGGPPFGEFKHELKNGTLRFWTQEPDRNGYSGKALQTVFRFYSIPKGLKVEER